MCFPNSRSRIWRRRTNTRSSRKSKCVPPSSGSDLLPLGADGPPPLLHARASRNTLQTTSRTIRVSFRSRTPPSPMAATIHPTYAPPAECNPFPPPSRVAHPPAKKKSPRSTSRHRSPSHHRHCPRTRTRCFPSCSASRNGPSSGGKR